MEQKLRIGMITVGNPYDKRSFSGVHFRMLKSLKEQGFIVITLGPVRLNKFSNWLMHFILLLFEKATRIITKKKYNKIHSHTLSIFHGRFFKKKINENRIDILFAPAASTQIAHLKTNKPICYYSDATVSIMLDYYNYFSGFSSFSKNESNQIEQRAINRSKTQVFSSKWAFDSAKRDYNAKNPFLVKMGANIDVYPTEDSTMKKYDTVINILFIGVDWERKGGPLILETIKKLDLKGYDIQLTVVGCNPPHNHPKMTIIPFLDKNKEHDLLIYTELFSKSHLFFSPTRADCTPMVFCEANAFGIPVISTDTGGVSSVIENEVNGFLLPISATSDDYFKIIENLINDKKKFERLAKTSRKKFLTELNWNQWGKEMKQILMLTHACRNGG